MERSPSYKETARGVADRLCIMALDGEAINYYIQKDAQNEREIAYGAMTEKELGQLFAIDEYAAENETFTVLGYDIEVKNELLAEAMNHLSEKKRSIILLSFFMDMSDAEIAAVFRLGRSAIGKQRKRALEMLRTMMEEIWKNEK